MKVVTAEEFLALPAITPFVYLRHGKLSSLMVKLSPPDLHPATDTSVFYRAVSLGIQVNHLSTAVFRLDINFDFVNSTVMPIDISPNGAEYVIETDSKFCIFDEDERTAIIQRLSSSIELLTQPLPKDPGDC